MSGLLFWIILGIFDLLLWFVIAVYPVFAEWYFMDYKRKKIIERKQKNESI